MLGFGLNINIPKGDSTPSVLLPPLDLYGSAAFAISFRLLDSTYVGNCIRVRRSSDNAETDIGFVDGYLDVVSLLSFVGAANAYIVTWYDQSGAGRNVSQATSGFQPQLVSLGTILTLNGKPAAQFNGTSSSLGSGSGATLVTGTGWTSLAVAMSNNAVSAGCVLGQDQGNPARVAHYLRFAPSAVETIGFNGSGSGSPTTDAGVSYTFLAQNIIVSQLSSNNLEVFLNNSLTNGPTAHVGQATIAPPFFVGTRNGSSTYLLGSIQEIIHYAFDNSANRAGVLSNMNSYYGVY